MKLIERSFDIVDSFPGSVKHVFWFIALYPLVLKLLGRAMKLDSPEPLKG